jgi:hypothetical protein
MSKSSGGGSKKIGRNKVKCAKYKSECRREANKRRIAKKIAHFMEKKIAKRWLRIGDTLRGMDLNGTRAAGR